MRLIATGFSNPPAATALPRKISAIPPTPIRSSSSYRVTKRASYHDRPAPAPRRTRRRPPPGVYHAGVHDLAALLDPALGAALASPLGSAAALSIGDAGVEQVRLVRGAVRRVPDPGPAIDERTPFDLASLTK